MTMSEAEAFTHSPIGLALAEAALRCRMVFFTGLPASGKSFLLRQQCLAAADAGRYIHLLRWDTGLSAFLSECEPTRYPQVDGTSNPVVRHAANLWGRSAVARWHVVQPDPAAMLIGEVPILGNRFSELVKVRSDEVERVLASEITRFFFPVPSTALRQKLERVRRTSYANPRHPDEAKDAPPSTMEWAWRITRAKAIDLGLVEESEMADDASYDAATNRRFFGHLLQHRHAYGFAVEDLFPIDRSAHDLEMNFNEIIATPSEVAASLELAENAANGERIGADLDNWYRI